MKETIIIGADPFGVELKNTVKEHLKNAGYDVTDVGDSQESELDYYQVGFLVGQSISRKQYDKGIIFCGTGMGVNIVANKFPGVYCGLCENPLTARLCRSINNCNVLSIGGILTGRYKALQMVDEFLNTDFTVGFPDAEPSFLKKAFCRIGQLEQELSAESHPASLFSENYIFLDIDAKTPDDVLGYVADRMYALDMVTSEFKEAVIAREKKYPTGLPSPAIDIAVPHTDPQHVRKSFIAVVRTQNGIPFTEMSTTESSLDAHIMFILGFKNNKNQVKVLQVLVQEFIQGKKAKDFMNCKDKKSCLEILSGIEKRILQES